MPPDESRYVQISRRAFLRRTAAAGLAAAVPGVILAACGSDAETFGSAATTRTTSTGATTAPIADPTTAATTTLPAVATSAALPDGAAVVVDFTYAAASSGRGGAKNPYIAVWVEDEAGDLVATIALWFLQSQKGLRWLNELRRWSTVDGDNATIDTISSATRTPGSYQVVWDGTTSDGERARQGSYHIAIEAAREHGPYSLIREPLTLAGEAFTTTLQPEGELTDAAVSLVLA